jgi:hypothetical protein
MIAWEHKSLLLRFSVDATHITEQFNALVADLGRQGWDVVTVVPVAGTRDLYVFDKRPTPSPIALTEPVPADPVAPANAAPSSKPPCPLCKGSKTVTGGAAPCPLCGGRGHG